MSNKKFQEFLRSQSLSAAQMATLTERLASLNGKVEHFVKTLLKLRDIPGNLRTLNVTVSELDEKFRQMVPGRRK